MRTHLTKCLVVVALLLAACGDDGGGDAADDVTSTSGGATSSTAAGATTTPTTTAPDTCTDARKGGQVTMGLLAPATSLDPGVQTARGTFGGQEMTPIYDVLMRYNPDTGDYEPRVAKSLEHNADFTDWTMTLRPEVTFDDGTKLTTAIVKSSIERHTAPGSKSTYITLLTQNLKSMEIKDDTTMVFHLTRGWAGFPSLLGSNVGMVVNPAAVAAVGAAGMAAMPPLNAGVGAYTVTRQAPGEELVLTAKDDWWGGPVCIQTLRLVLVPGARATYDAFKKGELDVAFLRAPDVIAEAEADGVESFSSLVNGGSMIMMNNGTQGKVLPTSDVRIRKAVAMALDPKTIDDRTTDGTGLPSSALIAEPSILYQDLEGPTYDPAGAKKLIDEVKAEGTWDGHIQLTLGTDANATELGVVVQALLQAAGFQVDMVNRPDTTAAGLAGDYELIGWSLSVSDSATWVELTERINNNPYMAYNNADMNAALDDLRVASTIDQKKAALADVQDVWNETVPSAIYGAIQDTVIYHDNVHGLVPHHWSVMIFAGAYLDG